MLFYKALYHSMFADPTVNGQFGGIVMPKAVVFCQHSGLSSGPMSVEHLGFVGFEGLNQRRVGAGFAIERANGITAEIQNPQLF